MARQQIAMTNNTDVMWPGPMFKSQLLDYKTAAPINIWFQVGFESLARVSQV